MKEKTYFKHDVKPDDFIALGVKELYCDKIGKNVRIEMLLKRAKIRMDIYRGWRTQDKNECTGYHLCKNKNCNHFKDFKIQEQK